MIKKRRILFIIASSDIGGAEGFVYAILKFLNNEKFEKYIICPAGGYHARHFKTLAEKALFIDPRRSFMNPAVIFRVSRFIRDNDIELVHTMLYTSDFCGIVAALLSDRHPRILNTINGINFLVFNKKAPHLKRRISSLIYRFIYRYSDKLIAVSEAVKRDLAIRGGIKVNPGKIETILAAGTDTEYHDFQEGDVDCLRGNRLPGKDTVISAVGKLNEAKNYDTMIEAFSLASAADPALKLFITGDGPDRACLEKKVCNLGIGDRIVFLGALPERKKNALLHLTDIFLMSSLTEGCPTALLEAMYFEKAIIATEVGGIPEIIAHGDTGLLVPAGDPARMAEAITDLAGNREKRELFGKRAKQVFERRFTARHMIGAYENAYDSLLAGGD